jgi:hypothetical protein
MNLYALPRRLRTFRIPPMFFRSTQTTRKRFNLAFLTSDISITHLTNEQTSPDGEPSSHQVGAPSDAATVWHEYHVVWLPSVTKFYIDSELVHSIDKNLVGRVWYRSGSCQYPVDIPRLGMPTYFAEWMYRKERSCVSHC